MITNNKKTELLIDHYKCRCGKLRGRINSGLRCPECGKFVEFVDDDKRTIEFKNLPDKISLEYLYKNSLKVTGLYRALITVTFDTYINCMVDDCNSRYFITPSRFCIARNKALNSNTAEFDCLTFDFEKVNTMIVNNKQVEFVCTFIDVEKYPEARLLDLEELDFWESGTFPIRVIDKLKPTSKSTPKAVKVDSVTFVDYSGKQYTAPDEFIKDINYKLITISGVMKED